MLFRSARVLVPRSLRSRVVYAFHALHHPGRRGTTRLLKKYFVWRSMGSFVKQHVDSCTKCGRAKVTRQLRPPPTVADEPFRRFAHVHIDVVGPLEAGEHRHLLTMIDRSTRWCEVALLKNTTAEEVSRMFISTWITRYGVPAVVTTDRGDRKSTRLNSSHSQQSRMPSSA